MLPASTFLSIHYPKLPLNSVSHAARVSQGLICSESPTLSSSPPGSPVRSQELQLLCPSRFKLTGLNWNLASSGGQGKQEGACGEGNSPI